MDLTDAVSEHNPKLKVRLDRLTELHHVDTDPYLATLTLPNNVVGFRIPIFATATYCIWKDNIARKFQMTL